MRGAGDLGDAGAGVAGRAVAAGACGARGRAGAKGGGVACVTDGAAGAGAGGGAEVVAAGGAGAVTVGRTGGAGAATFGGGAAGALGASGAGAFAVGGGTAGFATAGGGAGRAGTAAGACCLRRRLSTSPGLEIWERSILVLISSPLSARLGRADLPAPWASLALWKCARTLSASWSSRELEWVFFSVTPTALSTSRIALLLTSSSLARSLIRILLIRPFVLRNCPA
jgi:hypothetical protein